MFGQILTVLATMVCMIIGVALLGLLIGWIVSLFGSELSYENFQKVEKEPSVDDYVNYLSEQAESTAQQKKFADEEADQHAKEFAQDPIMKETLDFITPQSKRYLDQPAEPIDPIVAIAVEKTEAMIQRGGLLVPKPVHE